MDKSSAARMVALVLVVINAVLNLFGYETIPVEFGEHVTALLLIVISVWTAWKNNYLSKRGQAQKKALQVKGLYKK
jgi:SPP1 family holin